MDNDAFISAIQDALGSDRETAERAARAVLSVLGKRLGADEARVLVSHLPPQVGAWLHTSGGAQPFDAEGFVRRVAEREETDPGTAERHVIFVLSALARALPDREYEHMVARLSKDYAPLLPKTATPPLLSTRAFLDRIVQRSGVDACAAPRVAEAVLETLAERIADGEALDLTTRLPVRFHGAIKRGAARGDATTRKMAPDEFLRRVAQRAGVGEERARDCVRAVLATIRETSRDGFLDVTVQLPAGYRGLLGVG